MESKLFNADYEQQDRDQGAVLRAIALASGGFEEGTNAATIETASTVPFMINGKFYSKGATNNIAMTACAKQAVGKKCRYLISINAAGTVTITKGSEVRSYSYGAIVTASVTAMYKKIFDSAKGLGSFVKGDKILISGFTNITNNGLFTVMVVDDAGGWIQVKENCLVDEVAGQSVTIAVASQLPDLPVQSAAIGIITIITGTTAFTVGTNDLTDDIGTGSVAFENIGLMPAGE